MKRSLPSLEESLRILRTTRTRPMPKAPPRVQKQVQPLLKSLEKRFEGLDDGAARLQRRWPEIVGESLAKLCEPVRVIKSKTGGALEIRTANSASATLINHHAPALLDRINLFLGGGRIERLRIIQGPLAVRPRTTVPTRHVPLTAVEELSLQHSLDHVADDKLKASLLKLGRSVLKRQKQGTP